MQDVNFVHLIGSVTQDPELRYSPGGLAVALFTLAGKSEIVSEGGELRTPVFYQRCKAFGTLAERAAEILQAGGVASALGRLDYRTWENREGHRRSSVELIVESFHRLEENFAFEADARGQQVLLGAFNHVTLSGRVTRDSALRYTSGGDAVVGHALAVNERYADSQGEVRDRVGYFAVTAWRELAEATSQAGKGDGLLVVGRLAGSTWTQRDGTRRFETRIEAERLHLLPRLGETESAGSRPEAADAETRTGADPHVNEAELDLEEEELPF